MLELRFEKPSGFKYAAGQFVQFAIPTENATTFQSYSISSAPTDDYLEFLIKLLPNGKGSHFFSCMNVGDHAEMKGPAGRFIANNNTDAYYFVATGAGLAPIMAMLRDEIENKKTAKEVQLLFGVRSEEDLFWVDRLDTLAKQSEFFQYHVTLSQPKLNGRWQGLRGRVTDHLLHHLVTHAYYLCGNAAMVRDVRHMLIQNGISAAKIHFEIF